MKVIIAAAGTAGRWQRRTKGSHAIYVPELPHQRSKDQGSVSGYCGGGTGTHGNGCPDDQPAQWA